MKKKRILKFDQLVSNGTVHENYKDFESSIYAEVYRNATSMTEKIVLRNIEWIDQKKNLQYEDFERANVISFIGRRGTGKTSALISFDDALNLWTRNIGYQSEMPLPFEKPMSMRDVRFYSLKCIDASLLEESENIFVLILANMFSRIQNHAKQENHRINEYDQRRLMKKFEEIYEDFVSINSEVERMEGYSSYEKLRNAASSQRIRENFEELVKIYLDIIDSETINNSVDGIIHCKYKFLVILLDDIDLSRQKKENGNTNWGVYKIMNTIYKYLTVPGVIVLSAYDYENLYQRCENFFDAENEKKGNCRDAANQFVEKIFPISTRIYMPSWRKDDLRSKNEIKISLEESNSSVIKVYRNRTKNDIFQIKDFIFALLYEKAGVCFDYDRHSRHFFEPDTIRSLYNTIDFLKNLRTYDHTMPNEKEFEEFQYNIRKLKEDCYFRYKEEILIENSYERELFNEWIEAPVVDRSKKIVRKLSQTTVPLGLDIKQNYLKAQNDYANGAINIRSLRANPVYDNSNVKYSYAELIHSIYHMTRSEKPYSAKLVSCILYSFTLHLTDIYKMYLWEKRKIPKDIYINFCRYGEKVNYTDMYQESLDKQAEYFDILDMIIGEAVCGKWTQYFFPLVKSKRGDISETYGQYNKYNPQIVGYIRQRREQFYIPNDSDKERVIDELKIKRFLFFAMKHVDCLLWTKEQIDWDFTARPFKMTVKSEEISDYDMTGFLKYTFNYHTFLKKMEDILLESLETTAIPPNDEQKIRAYRSEVMQEIKKQFDALWDEYYEWDYQYGNMMMPVYNLDITYNMIKKLYQGYEKNGMRNIDIMMDDSQTPFLEEYIKMMDAFKECLDAIDKAYKLEDKEAFGNAFKECPFYKMVRTLQDDRDSRVAVSNYICNKVFDMISDLKEVEIS